MLTPEQKKQETAQILETFETRLKQKTDEPLVIIQAIKKWAGNEPFLTQLLCDLTLNYSSGAALRGEDILKLVQNTILDDWENNAAGNHLQQIRDAICQQNDDQRIKLLTLYRQVLQKGGVALSQDSEQKLLLDTGVVTEKADELKVTNEIYKTVFGLKWTAAQMPEAVQPPLQVTKIEQEKKASKAYVNFTRFLIVGVAGLALSVGLLRERSLIFSGVSPIASEPPSTETSPSPSSPAIQDPELVLLCQRIDITSEMQLADMEVSLRELQNLKTVNSESFPGICQSKLDELLYETGFEIARTDDFNKGLIRFCQMSGNPSNSLPIAMAQMRDWYNEPDRQILIEGYVKALKETQNQDCPVAKDLISDN